MYHTFFFISWVIFFKSNSHSEHLLAFLIKLSIKRTKTQRNNNKTRTKLIVLKFASPILENLSLVLIFYFFRYIFGWRAYTILFYHIHLLTPLFFETYSALNIYLRILISVIYCSIEGQDPRTHLFFLTIFLDIKYHGLEVIKLTNLFFVLILKQ